MLINVWLLFQFQVFRARTPPDAIALVSRLLEYTPGTRITPIQACAHPFFSELREGNKTLPNGREFPPLFNFTEQGKSTLPTIFRLFFFDFFGLILEIRYRTTDNYPYFRELWRATGPCPTRDWRQSWQFWSFQWPWFVLVLRLGWRRRGGKGRNEWDDLMTWL